MVREELKDLLEGKGMTEGYTLELLKEVIDLAKTKQDITNLMRAIENLQGMHGMKGDRVKKSIAVEEHYTKTLIDSIEDEKKKIELSQEKEE